MYSVIMSKLQSSVNSVLMLNIQIVNILTKLRVPSLSHLKFIQNIQTKSRYLDKFIVNLEL